MLDKIVNIINEETFVGEDNLTYKKVTYEILTPRKTYLKGIISGKYRGIKIDDDYDKADLFDFEIYEADVKSETKKDFRANIPFVFSKDFENIFNKQKIKGQVFPKSKLPKNLPVIITADEKSFGVNVLEPQLFEVEIIRKLHQIEGEEVFGSFNAYITGYILDYQTENREEILLVKDDEVISPPILPCLQSNVETGKTEIRNNYIRKEYKCINHNDTIWGNWEYLNKNRYSSSQGYNTNQGCANQGFGILGILLGLAFLIFMLPSIIYIIAFFLVIFILGNIAQFLKPLFKIISIVLLVIFFASFINSFFTQSHRYIPQPIIVDSQREVAPIINPVRENEKIEDVKNDSIITRYRSWKDYSGNQYEGKYQIKLSDYKKAHFFKENLQINSNSINQYDQVIFKLKEFDNNKFHSLFNLFDSIANAKKLDRIKFAEMVVTFVQDIPYALILDKECNANLYSDRFTRNYLLNNKGECNGNQRFGINTPVEFLVNLKGDCDTRTLLLYSILNHYKYDIALMSSEFYGHSVLGINLPLQGLSYNYNNQNYILWETTAPNVKPGNIPNEISNLNNWRISLKSK